jgi:branched-chain amino acid transport system substrate-binding protein
MRESRTYAITKGASALAKSKGLELVFLETYRTSPEDFSDLLNKVRAAKPDVLVAGSIRFEDLLAITRKLKELDLNIPMVSAVPYGLLPDYYKQLGKDAEFVYSGSFWDAALPYPGNQEFAAAYAKEFSHPPAVQSAGAYAGCQLLIDAIRRTGSLDSEKLREALLTLKTKTVFGDFAVDERGYQTAHKAVTNPGGTTMPRITALHMLRSTMKTVSAPASSSFHGSLPHPPRNRCVRFVFGVTAASRSTRFQAAR